MEKKRRNTYTLFQPTKEENDLLKRISEKLGISYNQYVECDNKGKVTRRVVSVHN